MAKKKSKQTDADRGDADRVDEDLQDLEDQAAAAESGQQVDGEVRDDEPADDADEADGGSAAEPPAEEQREARPPDLPPRQQVAGAGDAPICCYCRQPTEHQYTDGNGVRHFRCVNPDCGHDYEPMLLTRDLDSAMRPPGPDTPDGFYNPVRR